MANLTDYLENAMINAVLRGVAYTPPTSTHISLHTAAPDESGTPSNELTGSAIAYARISVATSGWTAPTNGESSNVADVTFATAGSAWGVITHVGIWDASTGGNLLFYGALANNRTIGTGDVMRFSAGNLVVRMQ